MKNYKWYNISVITVFSLIVGLTFQGCLKDHFDLKKLTTTEWDPSIAVPLVNATLDPYNILANTDTSDLIVIDPNTGLLALVYEGELFSLNADEIIDLPDQTHQETFTVTAAEGTSLSGGSGITKTSSVVYDFNTTSGARLDSLTFKQGRLEFNISSDFQHTVHITITMPTVKKNGVPFSKTIELNYTGGNNMSVQQTYDLSGYSADLSTSSPSYNKLPIEYSAQFISENNPVIGTEQVTLDQNFKSMKFSKVHGYFGQQNIGEDRDSILIRIFNNTMGGDVHFQDPQLKVNIDNSFGFPIELNFDTLASYNVVSGNEEPITADSTILSKDINYPSSVGGAAQDQIIFNTSNSTIADLITPTPKYLIHTVNSRSNKDGISHDNFMTDQSRFAISTQLEIPLHGYASNWSIVDTFAFNLGTDQIDGLEKMLVRVNITNGFPINGRLQLYFTDANYLVLDSLMGESKTFLVAPSVDGDGRVTEPTNEIVDIEVDKSRFPAFLNAEHVIIRGDAGSYNASSKTIVKIFADYELNIRIGLKADASLKLSSN